MPRTQISPGDCLRALGLTPEASWDEIRQAYLDLVRVWHPDRFQSDPQLRDRAQEQLQKINEAYLALKEHHRFDAPRQARAEARPEPPPPPPPPAQAAPRPQSRQSPLTWLYRLPFSAPARLVVGCALPLLFGMYVLRTLRVPTLDSVLITGSMPRPAILMPSRLMDSMDTPASAATTMAAWARGSGASLWRALPKLGEDAEPAALNAKPAINPADAAPAPETHHSAPAMPRVVAPVNGTEILWTRRSGEGELWITNDTGKDALVTLVQSRTTEPLRAAYIQANNKVCIRHIAVGVDDLTAEVGDDWDAKQFRFRTGRHSLGRSGPFNFFELASAQGSSGRSYEVVLKTR